MSAQRATQLVEAGLWLRLSGDQEGARRLFQQALKLDPNNARAQQLLAGAPVSEEKATPEPLAGKPPVNPFVRPDNTTNRLEADWQMATKLAEAPPASNAWDLKAAPEAQLQTANMGDAMDMVAQGDLLPSAKRDGPQLQEEVNTLLRGAQDLLELDDHSGAMELIVKATELAPTDPEVIAMRERSERTLQSMYESKLGDLSRKPKVVLKDDDIIWLNLDHRAGFVLAQIDGVVTVEDLFALSGMSRLDTARILSQLVEEGVITAE